MRISLIAPFCLALLVAGHATAQDAQQPSRRESFEHDGILWGSAAAWGVPFQENLGEDAKIAGLGRLWMEVKINFPNFAAVSDLDWDQTYVDFIPKVRATTGTYEYYRVLQRMCALLRDGHTGVFLPKELAERMEADLPLRTDLIEHRVFVTRVDSRELEADGVTAGLEILRIDGVPVHEYAARNRRPYVTSNSPQHVEVMVYSYALLAGPRDRPVTVEFRSRDGRVFEKRLARGPHPDATTLPAFAYRKLPGNIAYVALNTFNSEDVQKGFEQRLPEIRASDGLILDVRENDGGSGLIAYNLLAYLTDKEFPLPPWKSRQYVATLRVWGTPGGWYEPKPQTWAGKPEGFFSKPVVMLIGPRSLSATDVFAATFQRMHRGKLIGEPTAGSTGDPLPFALPGGGSGRVATSTDVGAGLIGKGVQPDVLVPRTAKDFLEERDAVLNAAVAELKR
ncbi:MAG TPA: S41 family peptidase [Thermoanaerobaculia bacterium]|jgi:C-terminal processing protease CtpA/Prc